MEQVTQVRDYVIVVKRMRVAHFVNMECSYLFRRVDKGKKS